MSYEAHRRSDPEVPDEALEEDEPAGEGGDEDVAVAAVTTSALRDPEVPEADALEQARDIPYDADYSE